LRIEATTILRHNFSEVLERFARTFWVEKGLIASQDFLWKKERTKKASEAEEFNSNVE